MSDRFYCTDLSGASAVLAGAEAHHALHVQRVKTGDPINLFDGRGTTAAGIVESAGRRDIVIAIQERAFHDRPQRRRITVAAAAPKGDRLKWMIEKLTELGVERFIPLKTERSVVNPGMSKLDKLQLTIIGAAKQCGRHWLLEIGEPSNLATLVSNISSAQKLHIAHPYVQDTSSAVDTNADSHIVLIGPEGGFSDAEVQIAMDASASPITWPETILRIETAAIMAVVALQD